MTAVQSQPLESSLREAPEGKKWARWQPQGPAAQVQPGGDNAGGPHVPWVHTSLFLLMAGPPESCPLLGAGHTCLLNQPRTPRRPCSPLRATRGTGQSIWSARGARSPSLPPWEPSAPVSSLVKQEWCCFPRGSWEEETRQHTRRALILTGWRWAAHAGHR